MAARTAEEAVIDYLRDHEDESVPTGDILSTVTSRISRSESTVRNALSQLSKAGRVSKPAHGHYALPTTGGRTRESKEKPATPDGGAGALPRKKMPVFGTASAGDGRVAFDQPNETVEVPMSEYQRTFGSKVSGETRLGYWRVDGDSAAPVFFDEELVPVELLPEPSQDFSPERVYVFRWNDHFYLKRLVWESREEVCAQSLNPAVNDFTFEPENGHGFKVLAKVIQSPKQQLYVSLLGEKLFS